MIQPVECHINFSESQWICTNDQVHIIADSLEEIDELLKKELQKIYNNKEIVVNMYFDFDRFPTWMRQYMPHYFNRRITFMS